jgi:hypothetical protein
MLNSVNDILTGIARVIRLKTVVTKPQVSAPLQGVGSAPIAKKPLAVAAQEAWGRWLC